MPPTMVHFWLLLSVGAILEVVTDIRQKDHLNTPLNLMGIIEVPDFDIEKATKNREIGDKTEDLENPNLLALNRRLAYCIETCRNEAANK